MPHFHCHSLSTIALAILPAVTRPHATEGGGQKIKVSRSISSPPLEMEVLIWHALHCVACNVGALVFFATTQSVSLSLIGNSARALAACSQCHRVSY